MNFRQFKYTHILMNRKPKKTKRTKIRAYKRKTHKIIQRGGKTAEDYNKDIEKVVTNGVSNDFNKILGLITIQDKFISDTDITNKQVLQEQIVDKIKELQIKIVKNTTLQDIQQTKITNKIKETKSDHIYTTTSMKEGFLQIESRIKNNAGDNSKGDGSPDKAAGLGVKDSTVGTAGDNPAVLVNPALTSHDTTIQGVNQLQINGQNIKLDPGSAAFIVRKSNVHLMEKCIKDQNALCAFEEYNNNGTVVAHVESSSTTKSNVIDV